MECVVDPRLIERAARALRRAGFELDGAPSVTKTGTVTFKCKVAD